MATFSPRFNFRLPERGVAGAPDDVVSAQFDVANNFSVVDQFMSVQVCTSLTRPVNPIASTLIFETDTGRVLRWTGSGWTVMGDPAGPQGPVGPASVKTTNTALSGVPTIICPITFTTTEANRWFGISFSCHPQHIAPSGASTDGVEVTIRWAPGAVVTGTDTALIEAAPSFPISVGATNGTYVPHYGFRAAQIPFLGQVTVGLSVIANGNMQLLGNVTDLINFLAVRDIGRGP